MCFRERILRRLPSNDLNEMPDEPNRNVEDQLKTWAQKRREEADAPFELHPAARKMLQDEVARTFPKRSDAPLGKPNRPPPYVGGYAVGWLKMSWSRFALTGSLCVALVVVVGILFLGIAKSKFKSQQLALVREQEKAPASETTRRDAPAQFAPRSSRAGETPVNRLGDEAIKAQSVESSAAQA